MKSFTGLPELLPGLSQDEPPVIPPQAAREENQCCDYACETARQMMVRKKNIYHKPVYGPSMPLALKEMDSRSCKMNKELEQEAEKETRNEEGGNKESRK